MLNYESSRIGMNRGKPRLWLQGRKAARSGFAPGSRYTIRRVEQRRMLILALDEDGDRVVSRKIKGGREHPVIDINSMQVLAVFDGCERVRVISQHLRIVILPAVVALAEPERLGRVRDKIGHQHPVLVGSLSHGGGVLSHALHAGLRAAGVSARLAFANEVRPELLEQAAACNDAWCEETVALAAPLQELAFDPWAMRQLPKVEILEAGLPCSGASISGRSRRGLACAEAHPEVGHLVVPFLAVIAQVQPAIVVLENVKQYLQTASMAILRNQLRDFGYQVHTALLQATDWNALERRERMCMVAVSEGIAFDFGELQRPEPQVRYIGEILDEVAPNDPRWSAMTGLKAKEQRDRAKGSGFAMQIIGPTDTSCPVITKGYAKVRSTDPKLQHPSDPDLLRQFSVAEHARIKGVPEYLVDGLSQTIGHELLGQSICYTPFVAVGRLVGQALKRVAAPAAPVAVTVQTASSQPQLAASVCG